MKNFHVYSLTCISDYEGGTSVYGSPAALFEALMQDLNEVSDEIDDADLADLGDSIGRITWGDPVTLDWPRVHEVFELVVPLIFEHGHEIQVYKCERHQVEVTA